LVGILFIISGLIKANDTTGFGYKLDEYWYVFHIPFLNPISVYLAMFICVVEIGLGISLLLGTFRKITLNLLILMIVFFTFLTFYSAYFDKVKECGCFGDAIKLTPWQSFSKDIALCILIGILWLNRKFIKPLWLEDGRGERILYGGIILSVVFTIYCWYYLPVVDFLPYAVGKDIVKQMTIPPGAPVDKLEMKFIYQKDGKDYFISMNQLDSFSKRPDFETYKYIDRKDVLISKGYEPPIHDFVIYADVQGGNGRMEVTKTFLDQKGFKLVIAHQILETSNLKSQKDIIKLVQEISKHGIQIWGLTSSSSEVIEKYKKDNGVNYNFYAADGTMLRTMIRANPGILLLKDNVIIGKWPGTMTPSPNDIIELMKNTK
jgi:uncharacterized membrane protein YphA (DoxX/SURF4 family)